MFKLIKKILPIADKLILGGIFKKKGEAQEGSPAGEFHRPTVIKGILQAVIVLGSIGTIYLFAVGKITFEQLEYLINSLKDLV